MFFRQSKAISIVFDAAVCVPVRLGVTAYEGNHTDDRYENVASQAYVEPNLLALVALAIVRVCREEPEDSGEAVDETTEGSASIRNREV